jgi:glutathione S-transferase
MEVDDGAVIGESIAICRYVAASSPRVANLIRWREALRARPSASA